MPIKSNLESLLKYGFDKLQLHRIYLNVLSSNKRAISFYKNADLFMKENLKIIYLLMIDIKI